MSRYIVLAVILAVPFTGGWMMGIIAALAAWFVVDSERRAERAEQRVLQLLGKPLEAQGSVAPVVPFRPRLVWPVQGQ